MKTELPDKYCTECGEIFQQERRHERLCPECRARKVRRPAVYIKREYLSRHRPLPGEDESPLTFEERVTRFWRQWLLAQLEPFLGHETVRMSDIIARIHGRPAVQKSTRDAA